MPFPSDVSTPPQAQFEVLVNENFDAVAPASAYSKRPAATSGLTWGYFGTVLDGVVVPDGTVVLTANATNYVVVNRGTGAVSVSAGTTNWNDTTNYARLYRLVTDSSSVTTEEDNRVGSKGLFGNAGAVASSIEVRGLLFTSDTDSTVDADPGNGLFRWNNATQTSATILYIDNQTADGVSVATMHAGMPAGGYLYMQQADDPLRWQLWKWSVVPTDGTGYRKYTVALQAAGTAIQDAKTTYMLFMPGSSGALVNFAEAVSSAAPNATIPVVSLTALNAATNVDIALRPKGSSGSLMADVPDNAAAGGNKRGAAAVDWQMSRAAATQVASGGSSTISGGTNNTASALNSTVAGGNTNAASNTDATVGGGNSNTASGAQSTVVGGSTNTASGSGSTAMGTGCTANGTYSTASGRQSHARGVLGAFMHAAGRFSTDGDAQSGRYVMRLQTTNATQTAITADGAAAGAANQPALPAGSVYAFTGLVVARNTANNDAAAWKIEGAIKNTGGTTALLGTPTVTALGADAGAAAWALAVAADNTNDVLQLLATGAAATTIRWVASIDTIQVA
jgi:hypothetical protein